MSITNKVFTAVVLVSVSLAWMANVSMAQDESKPQWESISGNIFEAKGIGGGRYSIGVDRVSGQVFVDCGADVLMSSDQGKTFTRLGFETTGPAAAACAKTGWSLWISPDGGRLAAFNSHMGNKACSGCSTDGGKTWKGFHNNWNWGVMGCDNDSMLAIGDSVSFSPDAGKTWTPLPELQRKNLAGAGVFGATELVISHNDGKIERSDDAGKTWKQVAANYACAGPLQVFRGVGYWLARKGDSNGKEYCILTSKDKGMTWQELCPIGSLFSGIPVFGKSEKEIFVATVKGIMATSDAGANWKLAAAYPEYMPESEYGKLTRAGRSMVNSWEQADRHIAYDPVHGVLYLSATTWQGPKRYLKLQLKPEAAAADGKAPSAGSAESSKVEKGRWIKIKANMTVTDGHGSQDELGVDRATGNLFVGAGATTKGEGSILMSADGGETFACVNDDKMSSMNHSVGGRGIQTDPKGGKIASFGTDERYFRTWVYSLDGGKTWERCAPSLIAAHGSWGVVGWDSRTMLVYGNEPAFRCSSTDLGKTWSPMDKNRKEILGAGIFSDTEWVESVSKTGVRSLDQPGQIERTADGGKTWAKVADYGCQGPLRVFKGIGYWTTQKDEKHWVVITTKDKGKTWQQLGRPFEEDNYINSGPIIGRDENHLFVATWWGILETTDAGTHWKMAAPFSGEGPRVEVESLQWRYLVGTSLPSVAYDAVHDAFYASTGPNCSAAPSGAGVWKYQR